MKKIGNEEYTTWEDIESELGISEEEMAEINLKVQLVEKIIEKQKITYSNFSASYFYFTTIFIISTVLILI